MAKESAAQRVERIKKEKNGLDVLKDIYVYAVLGEEVHPEDIDRFKWYGLYTQNRNLQAEDDPTLYFMLRIKLESGSMNLEQMREVSALSKEYGRGTADFTTRQDIQLHYIQVKDLPEIFRRLNEVGLSTIFAAGDVPRNVTTCAVSGIDHDELYDVRPIVEKVNDYLRGNKNLSNLPRKYKIGISACHKHCMGHEIQDLSFTAVPCDCTDKILFDVSVGGGLASNKQIASHIGFVTPSQILPIVKAVSTIYRDHGLRENRRKARLGHLIDEWGIEKFKEEVIARSKVAIKEEKIMEYTPYAKREHFGIHDSKEKAKSYIGCAINGGHIGSQGLEDLANILEKHGATTIKTTTTQNFVVKDVPTKSAEELAQELKTIGVDAFPSPFKARTLSCTGLNFCKFAISETKDKAISLAEHLEKKFPDFKETVSISVNGCPNSCAHPHVVDIGLLGLKVKNKEGITVPGFELILGGNLEGSKSNFGEKVKIKFLPEEAEGILENIIQKYIASGENDLNKFLKERINDEEFVSSLH
ncbi:nitrite/sulfite reductase [Arcobacter sp. KX21116]|uniref:nitrite/sulfite reductase n=1 Tax=Arcobacter iocasae TaxID=2906515 RepID=UPI0035D4B395